MLKLITSLFTNLASIEDTASVKQELRFLERFEARAGWVSADNAGLIAHKYYHLTFVECLGESKYLRRHEEIMRRPEVSARWDAAVTIDNLHTTDLYVDNDHPLMSLVMISARGQARSSLWGLLRTLPQSFPGITAQRRSETSIVDFYDRSFSSKLKTEVAHPDWPKSTEYNTFMAAVMWRTSWGC